MSQETINLLVGALIGIISSLLTQIVGNIFQRKNDERKRKWEIEERLTKRRLEITDNRIKEAKEYIELYTSAIQLLIELEGALVLGLYAQGHYPTHVNEIGKIIKATTKKMTGINSLNDKELYDYEEELRSLFSVEHAQTMEVMRKIEDHEDVDLSAVLTRISEFVSKTGATLGKINGRIEIIAQTAS